MHLNAFDNCVCVTSDGSIEEDEELPEEPLWPEDDDADSEPVSSPQAGTCWKTASAIVATTELQELLDYMAVRCDSCREPARCDVNRVSMSFCVSWVSALFM